MNASKEAGKHALERLEKQSRWMNAEDYGAIHGFLEAAIRKLPKEETYEKEAKRIAARKSTKPKK